MKKLFATAILFCSLSACLLSCKKDKASQEDPDAVRLFGCSDKNRKDETYICFDSLLTDSRCPADVVCVFSGYAKIKVSFHENNNVHVFTMMNKYDTTINGFKILFADLQPYPLVNKPPVPLDEIKAILTISR